MMLTEAIDSYLALKRSLGAVFSAETRILRSFGRALGDIPLDSIDRQATHSFCRGTGPPTRRPLHPHPETLSKAGDDPI